METETSAGPVEHATLGTGRFSNTFTRSVGLVSKKIADIYICRLADIYICRLADIYICRLADFYICTLADICICRLDMFCE
jgi:hypothetical protein